MAKSDLITRDNRARLVWSNRDWYAYYTNISHILYTYNASSEFGLWAKPSPVSELSFLPAPYMGWTRAGEKRVQDNLHAHAQNEAKKNY